MCNAQDNMLKLYKLVPDTTLYGEITQKMIKKIDVERNDYAENYTININLKERYWKYFHSITEKLVGSQMAVFLNDELIFAPTVNMPINKGFIGIYSLSQNKTELIYRNLGGKGKIKAFDKKMPNYYNDDYYPNAQSLFEQNIPIDSILLLLANAILSTPDNNMIGKRNEIFGEVFEWFLKESEKQYLLGEKSNGGKDIEPNSYTLKIAESGINTVMYYIVCLTKAFTENKNLSDTEVKIKATEYLIEYIFQKANYTENSTLSYEKIKQDKFLKSLKNKRNIKRLIGNID